MYLFLDAFRKMVKCYSQRSTRNDSMKVQIGSQLGKDTYQNLNAAAAHEVIQQAATGDLVRLQENDPLRLTPEQIRQTMEADIFERSISHY